MKVASTGNPATTPDCRRDAFSHRRLRQSWRGGCQKISTSSPLHLIFVLIPYVVVPVVPIPVSFVYKRALKFTYFKKYWYLFQESVTHWRKRKRMASEILGKNVLFFFRFCWSLTLISDLLLFFFFRQHPGVLAQAQERTHGRGWHRNRWGCWSEASSCLAIYLFCEHCSLWSEPELRRRQEEKIL